MHTELLKLNEEIDFEKYTLKDLALYYERFDGYLCKIITASSEGTIKFKFTIESFPHMIGMQYAYSNKKNSNEYRGASGFYKVKNGEITYNDLRESLKNNTKNNMSWKNIEDRIKFLPMLLNALTTKTDVKTTIGTYEPERATHMKGKYFLYRELHNKKTLILSLATSKKGGTFIESFVVDTDNSILKHLRKLRIKEIKLFAPLEHIEPVTQKNI